MNKVAIMEARARAELFSETAERMNVAEAIIEKDFWVCWVLKQLFSNKAFEGRLLFKGGTSLSKIFKAINRFSEDIDLAVDYETLGFNGENDPRQENISNTKRNKILGKMMEECQRYIGGEFLDLLGKQCRETLGAGHGWGLEVSKDDKNVVLFHYPAASTKRLAYLRPQVILELGTHAEFVPRDRFAIRSFAGEHFPKVVVDNDVSVVDANGPEEQVMGWYYYLDDKIRFPFQAKCIMAKVVSPLRKGESVQVQSMAPEDACSAEMLVLIRWQGRTMAVPLSQLAAVDPDDSTAEAIADWHYWVAQGYCF